jgi:hypothetical protein
MTINQVFEDISKYEKIVKKKYPGQKGRVILANIRLELDYEFGKPDNSIQALKWNSMYLDRIKKV